MSLLSRLTGKSSGYEAGDLVEFRDENGETQYGTYKRAMAGGVAVTQQTGPELLHGFKRVVTPAEPRPKDGE